MIENRNNINNLSTCSICGQDKNIIKHHNSYFPERVIPLCLKCHNIVHSYNSLQLLQLTLIIEQYSDNWKNYSDNARVISKLRYKNRNRKAEYEAEILDDFLSQREMAIDLLNHWEDIDNIQ